MFVKDQMPLWWQVFRTYLPYLGNHFKMFIKEDQMPLW
jgi:hypothetical protein